MKALAWFLFWSAVSIVLFWIAGEQSEYIGDTSGSITAASTGAVGAAVVALLGGIVIWLKTPERPEKKFQASLTKLLAGLDRQDQRRSDVENNRYRRSTPVYHSRESFIGWAAYRSPGDSRDWLPGRLHLEGSCYYLVPVDLDPMDGLKGIELWLHDLRALYGGGSFSLSPGVVNPLIQMTDGRWTGVAVILDDEGHPLMVDPVG